MLDPQAEVVMVLPEQAQLVRFGIFQDLPDLLERDIQFSEEQDLLQA